MIATAVADLRRDLNLPADPARRGPVPLDRFFTELAVSHTAIPGMTLGHVAAVLQRDGIAVDDLGDPALPLAGFLFVAGRIGKAFVNGDDILPRRRFTAAHELGHFMLHRYRMSRFVLDEKIEDGGTPTTEMEAEANRFAAELLMPEEVIRARAEELKRELRMSICPRGVLEYRLAAELLVSGQAIRFRLSALGVGDD